MQNHRIERRAKMVKMLGSVCTRCGTSENLEFNHIDPTLKEFNILNIWDGPWSKILEELEKCELLCHIHHLEATQEQWKSGQLVPQVPATAFTHGTARMYSESKCRCADCREAKKLYREGKTRYGDSAR